MKNTITCKGAALLFETLKETKSKLIKLNIDENNLDDECLISLGKFIENSKTIKIIYFKNNSLSDKAWEVLRATVPETALKMYEEKALEKMHQDKLTKSKEVQFLSKLYSFKGTTT